MKVDEKRIASQDSWVIGNDKIECAVTKLGGHMAPVTFCRDTDRPVRPYYISPWQDEGLHPDEPVLKMLRGDFFCFPFGAAGSWQGKSYVTHGETATAEWRFEQYEKHESVTLFQASMQTAVWPGTVSKKIMMLDGQNVLYIQHVLEGYDAAMSLGHHATLAVPETPSSFLVSTSPMHFGMNDPSTPDYYKDGEYFALQPGKRFASLREVPTVWKDTPVEDFSTFPRRKGFTDILSVFSRGDERIAWTTAVNTEAGYLWFSLKDPAVLPSTVFWMARGGRHQAPWNGRNHCLGLEDVCAYFAGGLKASVQENEVNREGIPTSYTLKPGVPAVVNSVQGAVHVPEGFGRVREARFEEGKVTFIGEGEHSVQVSVHHSFLQTGNPAKP